MIAKINGKLDYQTNSYAIVIVGGLGYRVYMTPEALAKVKKVEGEVNLWTYHVIREDSQELFGFFEHDELGFFEMLLKVPGIGPRSALAIMAVAPLKTLKKAVGSGDISYLTKISGIGKKTAEKVVLELKDKLGDSEDYPEMKSDLDVLLALQSLGYDKIDAREAIAKLPKESANTSDRIKEALKLLSNK